MQKYKHFQQNITCITKTQQCTKNQQSIYHKLYFYLTNIAGRIVNRISMFADLGIIIKDAEWEKTNDLQNNKYKFTSMKNGRRIITFLHFQCIVDNRNKNYLEGSAHYCIFGSSSNFCGNLVHYRYITHSSTRQCNSYMDCFYFSKKLPEMPILKEYT